MLTLDFVSKRYGKLPSEVMASASTFDLYVADLAMRYQSHMYEVEEAKRTGKAAPSGKKLSTEEMLAMIDNVRNPKT